MLSRERARLAGVRATSQGQHGPTARASPPREQGWPSSRAKRRGDRQQLPSVLLPILYRFLSSAQSSLPAASRRAWPTEIPAAKAREPTHRLDAQRPLSAVAAFTARPTHRVRPLPPPDSPSLTGVRFSCLSRRSLVRLHPRSSGKGVHKLAVWLPGARRRRPWCRPARNGVPSVMSRGTNQSADCPAKAGANPGDDSVLDF